MSIPEPETLAKPDSAQKLVRVEVEVPEDAIESLQAFVASLRAEPMAKAKDFKEFLTSGPEWTDEFIELVNDRDKRPARDIEL